MAISHPLDRSATGQADDVFYCLHPEMVQNGTRQKLDATSSEHASMRAEWVRLYNDILAHNEDGSRPFPACSSAAHDHHDPACEHCASPPVDPPVTPEEPDDVDPVVPDEPCEECETAHLVVMVKDADGNPVEDAVVNVVGLGGNHTDASGVADYGEVPVGTYDVTAEKRGHGPTSTGPVGQDEDLGVPVPAGTTTVVELIQHPLLTLVIALEHPVACPGHPLKMTAPGTPAGGTYKWTANGHGAELVDPNSPAALDTGPEVSLRCFRPDDATGEIPERKVAVSCTYTHPTLGQIREEEDVTVHKITFVIANDAVAGGGTQVFENAFRAQLANTPGVPTMEITPDITINLDASCPRKPDCAQNHDVGWCQTVLTNTRTWHYSHTDWSLDPNFLPIRDQIGGPRPFYEPSSDFTGDGDTQTSHLEDSPSQSAPWTDSRAGAPAPPRAANQQLTSVNFSNGFHSWLVVRNKEWWDHDEIGSFAYQRNFSWSCELNIAVDTTQAVGARCAPVSNAATIGGVGNGKGGVTPTITAPFPNTAHTITHVP